MQLAAKIPDPGAPRRNVIVLTHGWSGSSLLTALLRSMGYWAGGETMAKVDYDTHENSELVAINDRLLGTFSPDLDFEHHFDRREVLAMAGQRPDADVANRMADFVARCDSHAPWIWKDPRLTWTIRIWEPHLALDRVAFLVLTRDLTQAWITSNLRRHIQSRRFTDDFNGGITRANVEFLEERGLPYFKLSFEDLLLRPADALDGMNRLLGLQMMVDDLERVSTQPLFRKRHGMRDMLFASMIYAKNYRARDARGPGGPRTSPPRLEQGRA
jgi:hypothetical protein